MHSFAATLGQKLANSRHVGCTVSAAAHTRNIRNVEPHAQQRGSVRNAEPSLQQGAAPPLPPPSSPYELLLESKRFKCTECGKCCQGSGEVWANDAEIAAIARHLRMSETHFISRYTKGYSRRQGWRMLRTQPGSGDCVFLQGGTKCGIYPVRPMQCSTYPWWPELMDPVAWASEGQAVCEGIEHSDALPVNVAETAGTLRAATEYFAAQEEAGDKGWKQGKQ